MTGSTLFDPELYGEPDPEPQRLPPDALIVRIQPEVSGLDKEFDYLVEDGLRRRVSVGSRVRIELSGRRVGGWVTAVGVEPDTAATASLRSVLAVTSEGPTADLIDLARWAAHRWAGWVVPILKTASPPRNVTKLPAGPVPVAADRVAGLRGPSVIRLGPTADVTLQVAELAQRGSVLVVAPRVGQATALVGQLRRRQIPTRLHPRDWSTAAARGGVVVGARSAVWARVAGLTSIVVLDEHDEALQDERNPTWHARDVAIERAARAGIDCLLVSPTPSLAALEAAGGRVTEPDRSSERASWPLIDIVDRRQEEPGRGGLFSPRLADLVRSGRTLLAVLNRKGRAIMLACGSCGELARTIDGERLMIEQDGRLVAPSTGEERPLVCANCGGTTLKRLRLGVTRAAEEMAALAGEPVAEISGSPTDELEGPRRRIVVGTEAALHQLDRVDAVAFLDFDQELLAPRYRSADQAMALLVLAARLTGGRSAGGRVLVQTRTPDHRVLEAAVRADPNRLAVAEAEVRRATGLPPYGALAEASGAGADAFAQSLRADPTVTVLGPRTDGRYLIRADTPDLLADALAATPRPPGQRVRLAVDPPRA